MTDDRFLSPRPPGAPVALVTGTMNFGKRTPEPEAVKIIHRSLERGLRFFDTANAYNGGESERILGRALKGRRGEAWIATKAGLGQLGGPPEGLSPATLPKSLDASLERLGVDSVDLFYLHTVDRNTPFEATVEALEGMRRAGKLRDWAVSNHSSWRILEMIELCRQRGWHGPRVSQVIYNLLVRQIEVEYFEFAGRYKLHTTVYNPLAGGLLTGKVRKDGVEKGSRFDSNKPYQKRYLTDRFFELVEDYAGIAREASLSLVELAYGWIASRPAVDSILLGPATVAQLDAAIDAVAKPLPAGVAEKCDEVYRAYLGTDATYAR